MTERKILVVTFVNLVKDAGGPARLAAEVARTLHQQGRLLGIVCPASDPVAVDLPKPLFHSPPHPIFQRMLDRAMALLMPSAPSAQRRLREKLFDFFLSRSRILGRADAVLFLKPAFPRSARHAAKRGIPSFVWASILHPAFNRQQVIEEQKVWGVDGGHAYTDVGRIQDLERFFGTVDRILVGSRLAERSYAERGIPENSISLLEGNFPANSERFSPRQRADDDLFRVLHVSQMNLIKGIGYLLEAWSKAELEAAELVLVGSMEAGVAELYERLRTPTTRIAGFSGNVTAHYTQADLFVSPSVADLHPHTVLEAMASGIPVIVSDHCGVSMAVDHGQNGFVYPYGDTNALAEHIRWCHANPARLDEMGIAAREKAIQYSPKRFAETMIREIDRCTQSPPREPETRGNQH